MQQRIRMAVGLVLVAVAALLVVRSALAQSTGSSTGPKPPITDPNLLGKPNQAVQTIKTMADVKACLDKGVSAYGVALQNANVRSAPSTTACRYGRVNKGDIVEIGGLVAAGKAAPTVTATPAAAASGPTIGYAEDIQPLFLSKCSSCHSAAAKTMGLQTTAFAALMAGSQNGPVVVPGDPEASKLWQMVGSGKMPATGPLPMEQRQLVYDWIKQGAAEHRAVKKAAPQASAGSSGAWFSVVAPKLVKVADACSDAPTAGKLLVSADLIAPVSCGAPPSAADLKKSLAAAQPVAGSTAITGSAAISGTNKTLAAAAKPAPAAKPAAAAGGSAGKSGIQAAAMGLPEPAESDPFMQPKGFCIERHLPDNHRGITAMSFAPDGKVYLAMDSDLSKDVDRLILYDAFHPSRSIAVYDPATKGGLNEIMKESPRITGLDYYDGALYISRAGEVGRIPDGGKYEKLADGFAVASQLFHANDGIVISNGYVYISAGGVRDGYVDGPIVGVGEEGAQNIVSGGNPYAARIVRAPLDKLLSQKNIQAFSTAGRGVRNPYGITADPSGQIWFTDNGATNVPDDIPAGDEVDVLNPANIGGDEGSTPYYGFPLALSGNPPDWYTKPVVTLVNSEAPTGITWAYNTIFFNAYGRNPGLYRLGRAANGSVVAERVMQGWPLLSLATAPDGALWVGMGDGGLYRMTPGCN